MNSLYRRNLMLLIATVVVVGACSAAPQVTRVKAVPESADVPYKKILVVSLFTSFDSRIYHEKEVVLQLAAHGTDAVASTTMMDSRTPLTRSTFIAMIEEIDADALLVSQLANLEVAGTVKDMRPELTVNFRPTYYYNVYSVETTEYVEPPSVEFEYSLGLVSEVYSVRDRESVWAIESNSKIVMDQAQSRDYSIYVIEAKSLVHAMSSDGLIVK